MSDSIRQRIIDAIDARLRAISVANGYATNLGQNVSCWKLDTLGFQGTPAADYRDVGQVSEVATIMGADSLREFRLSLHVDSKSASTSPDEQRAMAADIMQAVGVDPTWGGLAIQTDLDGDETELVQDYRTMGATKLRFIITYRTKIWNLYEQ